MMKFSYQQSHKFQIPMMSFQVEDAGRNMVGSSVGVASRSKQCCHSLSLALFLFSRPMILSLYHKDYI